MAGVTAFGLAEPGGDDAAMSLVTEAVSTCRRGRAAPAGVAVLPGKADDVAGGARCRGAS